MATPTRTITGLRFFKKAIKKFIKNRIIYPMSYYYGYYAGGGIGTQNLLKRYSTYVPLNPQDSNGYYYIRVVDNNLSVPPFSYSWTGSSYVLKFNVGTNSGFVPVQIPFDKIEYGGTIFNKFYNWQPIDILTQKHELMRNAYLRIKQSDLNALVTSVGGSSNSYIYLDFQELWGTGNYPTGVTYFDTTATASNWYLPTDYNLIQDGYDGEHRYITIKKNYTLVSGNIIQREFSLNLIDNTGAVIVTDPNRIYVNSSAIQSVVTDYANGVITTMPVQINNVANYTQSMVQAGVTTNSDWNYLRLMFNSGLYTTTPYLNIVKRQLVYKDTYDNGQIVQGVVTVNLA